MLLKSQCISHGFKEKQLPGGLSRLCIEVLRLSKVGSVIGIWRVAWCKRCASKILSLLEGEKHNSLIINRTS